MLHPLSSIQATHGGVQAHLDPFAVREGVSGRASARPLLSAPLGGEVAYEPGSRFAPKKSPGAAARSSGATPCHSPVSRRREPLGSAAATASAAARRPLSLSALSTTSAGVVMAERASRGREPVMARS